MKIIYGTKNIAKIEMMKNCLKELKDEYGLSVVGLNELNREIPDVEECGISPEENAKIKAMTYYSLLKMPVFSLDSGLYLKGLPDQLQPGLNIRRVNGKRLDDEEMIQYYSGLARANGGKLVARYRNGICFVINEQTHIEYSGDDIASHEFMLTNTPHKKRVDGFPLNSLSVDIDSNQYSFDIGRKKYKTQEKGFYPFSAGLCRFYFKRCML